MALTSNKLQDNDKLQLPKEFKIDENTIFKWDIKDNDIILTPKQKVGLDYGYWNGKKRRL